MDGGRKTPSDRATGSSKEVKQQPQRPSTEWLQSIQMSNAELNNSLQRWSRQDQEIARQQQSSQKKDSYKGG